MINAILVINHYLHSKKFDELYKMFKDSAYRYKINLSVKTNREINFEINTYKECTCNIDFFIFWDKDIILAKTLEEFGYKIYNKSHPIEICDDKAKMYSYLCKDIPMPKTIFAPFSYNDNLIDDEFLINLENTLTYPFVVKAKKGSFGADVHLCPNKDSLINLAKQYSLNNLIFQEFIDDYIGRDIRFQVVGPNVVCGMYRYSDTDFRANVTNGGKMKAYKPTELEKKLAIKVCKRLGLDFAGVDILWKNDKNNKKTPLLCEVNSNAHFVNLYNCTQINVSDEIFKYILKDINTQEI